MAPNRFGPSSAGQAPTPAESNNPMLPQPEQPAAPAAPQGVQPLQAPDDAQTPAAGDQAGRQEGSGSLSHLQRLKKFKANATEEMYELKGQVRQQQEQLSQILALLQGSGGNAGTPQQTDEIQQLETYLSSDQVQQQPHLLGAATAQYVKASNEKLKTDIQQLIRQEIGSAVTQERNTSSWKQDLIRTFGAEADDPYSELSVRAQEIFKEYQRRYPQEPLTPAVVKLSYMEAAQSFNQDQVQQTQPPGIEPNAPAQPYTAPVAPGAPEPGQMLEGGSMGNQDASRAEAQAVQAGNWRAGIAGAVGRIYADRVGA